jgi:hypothetical protein
MEWLFITCHNYWIICRLVKDEAHPFLAYSSMMSIEDSSEPFRAFLGAILSVIQGVAVEKSLFDPDMELDIIKEDKDKDAGILLEDHIDDGPGAYPGPSSTGTTAEPRMTCRRARHEATTAAASGLMVRSWL